MGTMPEVTRGGGGGLLKKRKTPKTPAEDVNKLTKGLHERKQLIEWDNGET